ncbi:hypothetical protein J2Z60_001809 [Lactobacillus colini]|uniref:Uncharacterized protein n=1 Tax=Lactobacillus colini TaxID=1819254 RepID=A0ABS4MH27_9LACO|nr:hypothetical protein [Lactobacillus colini]MBP2058621.1 hypothetical protein [Lactobacillus colini]
MRSNFQKAKIKMFFFFMPTDKSIEDEVNKCIEDKDVIDIKFTNSDNRRCFTVMVIYNALKEFMEEN